jgi:Relaxase/Mobilisation nuclease domain
MLSVMVGKIKRGSSFKGVCDYLLATDKEVAAEIIGGTMISETPAALAAEFEWFSQLNARVKMPVKHFSISFAPEDGEVATDVKCALAAEYMERMGYGNSQYLVVSHSRSDHDHDHDHIHIVANAVDMDGKWVNDRLDWKKSQTILRALESEYNLTPVMSSWDKQRDKSMATRRDRRVERLLDDGMHISEIDRTCNDIQAKISQAAPGAKTMTQFCARLQSIGIEPIPRITRMDKIQGLSYKQGDVVVRGSDLYACSFPALQLVRGIDYDAERDLSSLKSVFKGERLEADEPWMRLLVDSRTEANEGENLQASASVSVPISVSSESVAVPTSGGEGQRKSSDRAELSP